MVGHVCNRQGELSQQHPFRKALPQYNLKHPFTFGQPHITMFIVMHGLSMAQTKLIELTKLSIP